MRRFYIILIPILLFMVSNLLIVIPDNCRTLDDLISQLNFFSYVLKILFVLLAIAIFLIYNLTAVMGTLNKFIQFDTIRPDIIGKLVEESLNIFKELGIEFRVNVMLVKFKIIVWKRFIKFLRPFIFQKQFKTVYHYNMEHDRDKDLGLITKQGVAGLAYNDPEGKHRIVDFMNVDRKFFKLDKDQLDRTKSIKFVISTPILKWNHETGKLTDKVIGVVNIDSRNNSFKIIQEKVVIEDLVQYSYNIADYVAKLY